MMFMRLKLALSQGFVTAACVTVLTTPLWVSATMTTPSQDQRYFHEVALKWGQLANDPVQSDNPAVLKAGISAYSSQYRLDSGDVLSFTIPDLDLADPNFREQKYKTTNYVNEVQVDRDGMILLPSFGTFRVSGLTTHQTQEMVREMARYYLQDPKVYVGLKNTRPFSIYLKGEVRHPGGYQINGGRPVKVVDENEEQVQYQEVYLPKVSMMIKRAGGILPNSDLENVEISNLKTNKRWKIDLKSLVLNGDSAQDVLLEPDDVITIPRGQVNNNQIIELAASTLSPDKYQVKILGFVNRTSVGTVELDSRSMTVSHALNKLNVDPDANLRKIAVLRKDPNSSQYQTLMVDVTKADLSLEPDDTILVTHKRMTARMRNFMQAFIQPLGNLNWGAAMWFR
jgi:protein involved in polysaccharide export with SLBB domain